MPQERNRLALLGLCALIGLVYWPGLSGPWLFDDFSNIRDNAFLRVTTLEWASLHGAAGSLAAGPLGRPVAYLSFALNHYAHGDATPYAYKLTNVVIHAANALLVAALLGRVLRRVGAPSRESAAAIALAITALWALHPLQLTSVLYVVQRMTSLSATFTLAALLCLLRARETWGGASTPQSVAPGGEGGSASPGFHGPRARADGCGSDAARAEPGNPGSAGAAQGPGFRFATSGLREAASSEPCHAHGALLQPRSPIRAVGWLLAATLLGLLGVFTKETAVLLPLFAVLLDRVMYPDAPYWRRWRALPARLRFGAAAAAVLGVLALAAWHYAPGYAGRPFTLAERGLTQARVLWFYLGLVVLPRINAFGLHHDDIALSTGVLTPWTTLPALLGVAALGVLAFRCMDRRPLVGLGIAWFLIGHVLESTVVPLEIAHEHRNYLPSLGILLALTDGVRALAQRAGWSVGAPVAGLVAALLAGTTALRADQWGDELGMSRYEVRHHPRSAQARNNLAADLVWRGDYAGAREHLEAAIELAPREVGYPMNLVGAYRVERLEPPAGLTAEILQRIATQPMSAFASTTLKRYSECLDKGCAYMAADVTAWLEAYAATSHPTFDRSYVQYLLGVAYREQGRIQDALNAFQRAHDLDPQYLHPLFAQANILLALRQWDGAAFVLENIRAANEHAYQRLDAQIAQLEAAIAQGRRDRTRPGE
jgi:protein O-mannosyl-transferase